MALTQSGELPGRLPTAALVDLKLIFDTSYVLQQGANDLLTAIEHDQVLDCDRSQLINAAGFCGWIAADSLFDAQLRMGSYGPSDGSIMQRPEYRGPFPLLLVGVVPGIHAVRARIQEAVSLLARSEYDLCATACDRARRLHEWSLNSGE